MNRRAVILTELCAAWRDLSWDGFLAPADWPDDWPNVPPRRFALAGFDLEQGPVGAEKRREWWRAFLADWRAHLEKHRLQPEVLLSGATTEAERARVAEYANPVWWAIFDASPMLRVVRLAAAGQSHRWLSADKILEHGAARRLPERMPLGTRTPLPSVKEHCRWWVRMAAGVCPFDRRDAEGRVMRAPEGRTPHRLHCCEPLADATVRLGETLHLPGLRFCSTHLEHRFNRDRGRIHPAITRLGHEFKDAPEPRQASPAIAALEP